MDKPQHQGSDYVIVMDIVYISQVSKIFPKLMMLSMNYIRRYLSMKEVLKDNIVSG